VGGSTLDLNPGDGLILLDEHNNEVDGGDIDELKEGFSAPKGFAPTSSTITVHRRESFKAQGGEETEKDV